MAFGEWGLWDRVKPPSGCAQIDWSDPLNIGLKGCWMLDGAAGPIRNLINSKAETTRSGTIAADRSPFGPCFKYTPNAYFRVPGIDTGAQITMLTWFIADSFVNSADWIQNQQDSYTIRVPAGGGSLVIWIENASSSYQSATWSNALSTGVLYCAVGTYDGATISVYVNGQKGTDGSQSGNIKAVTGDTIFGCHSSLSSNFASGKQLLSMIWSRALKFSEVRRLYESPFDFLQVSGVRRYFIGVNQSVVFDKTTYPWIELPRSAEV